MKEGVCRNPKTQGGQGVMGGNRETQREEVPPITGGRPSGPPVSPVLDEVRSHFFEQYLTYTECPVAG